MSFLKQYIEFDRTAEEAADRLRWFENLVAPELKKRAREQGYEVELLVVGSVKSGKAFPDSDIDVQVRNIGSVRDEPQAFGVVRKSMKDLRQQSVEYERYKVQFVPNDRGSLLNVVELFRRDKAARGR